MPERIARANVRGDRRRFAVDNVLCRPEAPHGPGRAHYWHRSRPDQGRHGQPTPSLQLPTARLALSAPLNPAKQQETTRDHAVSALMMTSGALSRQTDGSLRSLCLPSLQLLIVNMLDRA